jgi:hypothetical protein
MSRVRTGPLRAEYVVPGLALVLAAAWLAAAIERPGEGLDVFANEWLETLSTGAGLLILAAAVGIGYAIGILLVQITYDVFGARMRDQGRARHLKDLRELEVQLPEGQPPYLTALFACAHKWAIPEERKGRTWLWPSVDVRCESRAIAVELLGDLARDRASVEVMREVEYRRANRQLFLGVLPSVPVAAAAACVTVIHTSLAADLVAAALALVGGVVGPLLLIRGACFQEKTIERLLLNVAHLHTHAPPPSDS